jgi:hypothetical protein
MLAWLLGLVLSLVTSGWGAAAVAFAQTAMAMTSLPGMVLFTIRGALHGDVKKALHLVVRLGTLYLVLSFIGNRIYKFRRILAEEEAATAKGCVSYADCGNMAEVTKSDPAQAALCLAWNRTCHWNPWDRAIDRYTDIFPTLKDLTDSTYSTVLLCCAAAAVSYSIFFLIMRCCAFGKKTKRKREARDAQQLQEAWTRKADALKTFPVA